MCGRPCGLGPGSSGRSGSAFSLDTVRVRASWGEGGLQQGSLPVCGQAITVPPARQAAVGGDEQHKGLLSMTCA